MFSDYKLKLSAKSLNFKFLNLISVFYNALTIVLFSFSFYLALIYVEFMLDLFNKLGLVFSLKSICDLFLYLINDLIKIAATIFNLICQISLHVLEVMNEIIITTVSCFFELFIWFLFHINAIFIFSYKNIIDSYLILNDGFLQHTVYIQTYFIDLLYAIDIIFGDILTITYRFQELIWVDNWYDDLFYAIFSEYLTWNDINIFSCKLTYTHMYFLQFVNWIKSITINLFVATLMLYLFIIFCNSLFKFFNYKHMVIIVSVLLLWEILITLFMYITEVQTLVTSEIFINNNLLVYNPLSMNLDNLSLQFLLTIFIISFFINLYQYFYLADVINKESFFNKLNIFILSIIGVVVANNWLLLLLSWEILGQSSFFLISFFYNKPVTIKSAFKAFFFNKISDIFLILACIFYFKLNHSFIIIQKNSPVVWSSWISCFLLITAFIKSAQFIFYFWLPDSMDAPVPASALIHSATLVAAGIYLVLRFINNIELNNVSMSLLLISSTITMLFSSLIAANQTDIKKLLAYSTISNCAFIYFLIFINNYALALNYFMLHGFLKSLSFMIAGILIRNQHHSQDMRKWRVVNLNEQMLLLLLIFILLLLGTTPVSILYNIKNDNISNFSNEYISTYCSFIFYVYTLNSYMYSIKPLIFFFNKKLTFNKYKSNVFIKYKYFVYLFSLILCYLMIIIAFIVYFYSTTITYTTTININFILTPILILVYLIYFNKYDYPIVLIWIIVLLSISLFNIV